MRSLRFEKIKAVTQAGQLESLQREEKIKAITQGGQLESLQREEKIKAVTQAEQLESLQRKEKIKAVTRTGQLESLQREEKIKATMLLLLGLWLLLCLFCFLCVTGPLSRADGDDKYVTVPVTHQSTLHATNSRRGKEIKVIVLKETKSS